MVKLTLSVILAGLILTAAVAYLAYDPIPLPETFRLTIHKGATTNQVAVSLDSLGLLRSKRLFKWWVKYQKIDRRLRPGRYTFAGPTAMADVVYALRRGDVAIKITIPEGWTNRKIAAHLAAELGIDSTRLVDLTRDSALVRRENIPIDQMEGYLLPNTYEFYWGIDPVEIIDRMVQDNRALFPGALDHRMDSLGWNRHTTLTLASMIEAETANADERPRVSAVFHNRMKRGMPMQCDPTVVYAIGGLTDGRSLSSKDLEFPSPYNTYLNTGLPPGPICNPGRAAILAALYPDSSDDLYFVADGRGHHIFSKTLDQHNLARLQVRKEHNGS